MSADLLHRLETDAQFAAAVGIVERRLVAQRALPAGHGARTLAALIVRDLNPR